MWTPFITASMTVARDWLPEVITALRLVTALFSFSIAIHRGVRYWRSNRKH